MMRRGVGIRAGWLLLALLLALGTPGASAAGTAAERPEGVAVGYYAAWAGGQGYGPERLPAERLDQVNYAFAEIEGGRAVLTSPDRDRENLRGLTALRQRNPDLKIVLSLGGWDGSGGFSDAASTAARRETFARSCLDLLLAHDLDGVDLDWEYPVSGGSGVHRAQDRENFTLLLRTLRRTLDRQSRTDGRDYLLTIAGAAGQGYLNCIEPQAVAETVDHIFVMAYDFHGPWDRRADFNAPVYAGGQGGVDAAVSGWLSRGVAAEKLVLGMPMYGYIYQGCTGPGGSFASARSVSYDAVRQEYLTNPAFRQLRHSQADVPYLLGNGAFLSYDDEASIAAKAALARERGLGGFGFWELSQDRTGKLLESALTAWNGGGDAGFRDVPADAWYASAVRELSAAGLMNGTAPGLFSPGRAVTRGQTAAILHRLAGGTGEGRASFTDVPPASYCAQAVAWAADEGIVEGYPDGTFHPDRPVSRQQLAAILWRYARFAGADSGRRTSLRGYRDAGDVSAYAQEPLRWALAEGILQGTADGRLNPGGSATRAQTAVILSRFRTLLEK
ncbi:glycosyl hydrolase family 18 protein [uncultured Oscillibacter sp.]|uniref:glycosyl hydrolase family 18 protein n=1 Tax=uncultured Oscillibacter sp. TaxID=876091 RepID=UPI0026249C96|nr:glycosyl hydrolase family 18 protein [uncultured Oscillibacter sp.]